jgi:hypothetical protein
MMYANAMDEFETPESRSLFEDILLPGLTARYPLLGPDICKRIHEFALFDPQIHTAEYAARTGRVDLLKFVGSPDKWDESNKLALVAACAHAQMDVLKYLLEDLNMCPWVLDDEPIFAAARARNLDVIAMLAQYGADPFGRDLELLFAVMERGDLELLQYLIDHEDEEILAELSPVLKMSVIYGHMDIIRYVFERGIGADDRDVGLQCAAARGELDILKYFVDHGGDIHSRDDTALFVACENEHLEVVRYLLEQGADVAADEFAAVLYVCKYDDLMDFVKCFIEFDDGRLNYGAMLEEACYKDALGVVRFLVEEVGVDFRAREDAAFVAACKYGSRKTMEYFVPQITNTSGAGRVATLSRGLCGATNWGDMETIKYLIELGADVRYDDDLPLRTAALPYPCLNAMKLFVELGADIHAHDDKAICTAAAGGYLKMVEYLAEQGGNVHLALAWAAECGQMTVMKYLITIDAVDEIELAHQLAKLQNEHEAAAYILNYMQQ